VNQNYHISFIRSDRKKLITDVSYIHVCELFSDVKQTAVATDESAEWMTGPTSEFCRTWPRFRRLISAKSG